MQRKFGAPGNTKLSDAVRPSDKMTQEDQDVDSQQRKLLLINFAHSQWGFNHWSWSVTKQDLDFVDFSNGKYSAGVVAFVSVTVKSLDIHREDIGYATTVATQKGAAIYRARKSAVTNALRETLLSFGGSVATELQEYLECQKVDLTETPALQTLEAENNLNIANVANTLITNPPAEPKNSNRTRKDAESPKNLHKLHAAVGQPLVMKPPMAVGGTPAPPVARAHPMPAMHVPPVMKPSFPANMPPAPASASMPVPPAPPLRPNSNEDPGSAAKALAEEEARAERLRRQKLRQAEFRQKHTGGDIEADSIEKVLVDIGNYEPTEESAANNELKRKSADCLPPKRRASND